jgi:predicted amidohydrolase YtcJ
MVEQIVQFGFRCLFLGALLGAYPSVAADDQNHPDYILHNGQIYTADNRQATVSAMAVSGDKITAVGSSESLLALRGPATELIDLQGGRVLPGLHDTHIHPAGIVKYASCDLDNKPHNLQSLSKFVAKCVDRMRPAEGDWLSVRQWTFGENNLPSGGFKNIRQALDTASAGIPIIVLGNDGHHNATNSAGLARAMDSTGKQVGMTAKTLRETFAELKPFVGVDAQGEPDGAINEGVHYALGAPGLINADTTIIAENAAQIPARLNSIGITSIQDAAVATDVNKIYEALIEDGPLTLRIRLAQYYLIQNYIDETGQLEMPRLLAEAAIVRDRWATVPNISANTLKYFVDGVLEGNPLATPPTLPNAAHLKQFHQPRYSLDTESGTVKLLGYVDTDSQACVAWRSGNSEASDAAFVEVNGFHPGQCQQSSGVMYAPAEITMAFAKAADAAGFAIHFHAIGDQSVRTAVDAIEAITPAGTELNKHSLTHLQLVDDPEIRRLGELKAPIAFTFAWARSSRGYDATVIPFIEKLDSLDDMYNPESYYYKHFYPANSIRKAGGIVAAGSDAPVETDDPRPFVNIEAAVTRDRGEGVFNPEERLPILDAIDAYTINGAKLLGQNEITGSLEPGKKADFILLDRDIVELANQGKGSQIHKTKVLATWFDGQVVYQAK